MNRARQRKTVAARVAKVAPVRTTVRAPAGQVCLGRLVRWDADGPIVEVEGSAAGPVRARVVGARLQPGEAPAVGQEVVLLVDARAGRPPIVLGVVQPLGRPAASPDVDAKIDGKRIELEGHDEIVLRCGEASITLRRNGRVLIQGVQVETRARGVNRIKGGSVSIN
jgi:hypothetical protein